MDLFNEKTLHELVNNLSQRYFNQSFAHKVCFNYRLRTTGGRYLPAKKVIELNPKYLTEMGHEELVGIIKHELCHYHLHIAGKPYGHGSREFKALLHSTGAPRHCKTLPSAESAYKHSYICEDCGYEYQRRRRVDVSRFICGRCKGTLKLMNSQ